MTARKYKRGRKPDVFTTGGAATKPRDITDHDRLAVIRAALAEPATHRNAEVWQRIATAAKVDRWAAEAIATLNGDPDPVALRAAETRLMERLR